MIGFSKRLQFVICFTIIGLSISGEYWKSEKKMSKDLKQLKAPKVYKINLQGGNLKRVSKKPKMKKVSYKKSKESYPVKLKKVTCFFKLCFFRSISKVRKIRDSKIFGDHIYSLVSKS